MRTYVSCLLVIIALSASFVSCKKKLDSKSILMRHGLYHKKMTSQELQVAAYMLYKLKKYRESEIIFRDVLQKNKNMPAAHLNFACLLATNYQRGRLSTTEEIFKHLNLALQQDKRLLFAVKNDPDLEPVRRLPEYKKLLKK